MAEPPSVPEAPPSQALPTTPSAGEGRIIKKRNRVPVSCEPCRKRRSKCNRAAPCGACDKRGEGHLCAYAKASEKQPRSEGDGRRQTIHGAQDRLQELENLVLQLIGKDQAPSGYQEATTTPSYQPTATSLPGNSPESSQPHWSAILNGIQELRSAMQHEEASPEPPDGILDLEDRPVLLAAARPSSLNSILHEYLPFKGEVDRRIMKYFRSEYMVIPVIHSLQFESQYRRFWESPTTADPVWIALLFAILSLSAQISHETDSSVVDTIPTDRFIHASAASLNLAGYSRPRPHLIPALLLLAQSIYVQNYDPSREVALVLSMITRLAFQSGLHREPSPTLSIFEAELHRRTWVMIRHFDLQCACQFGVPSAIPYNACDVQPPRNLTDQDLTPDMTSLPPSKPDTEHTPLSAFIIKNRIMQVLAEVYFHACSVRDSLPDSEMARLDAEIHKQYDNLPELYKSRPIASGFNSQEHVITARLTCALLAHKSICILHRRRMAQGNLESKNACMNAAATIIERMTDFVDTLKPGGWMEGQTWMITSTNVNDFLLGAMVLCAGVVIEEKQAKGQMKDNGAEYVELLQKAKHLCSDLSTRSRGAKRVGEAIGVLLMKMGKADNVDPLLNTSQQPSKASQNQYGIQASMSMSLPISNADAMSSLAAAAAQLSPDMDLDAGSNRPQLPPQSSAGPGYSWATPENHSSQLTYQSYQTHPSQVQSLPQGLQQQSFDPFEQLFSNGSSEQASAGEVPRGEIDWAAFDQFITAGDLDGWDPNG